MAGISHRHLCTEAPNRGEPAWLMLVETGDGRFFLEDEFGDWGDRSDVNPKGTWPPIVRKFDTEREALERAADLISLEFGTDRQRWLEASQ